MPTAKKRTPTATATAKDAGAATPTPAAGEAAFLRFYLTGPLHARLMQRLGTIESAVDASKHKVELSETLVEVMNEGLDYYFIRSLKLAKSGFIIQQSAKLGLAGAQRVMAPVIRQIVSRMEHEQLLLLAAAIRGLMH